MIAGRPLILATALLMLAGQASANAMEDGNAGLTALGNGDYDQAIGLFSHAIDSRELSGDDLENAYASRGRAYLKKGDLSSAIVDLDRARRMKPDDADAQNDLVTALQTELPADQIPGQRKASIWPAIGGAILGGIAVGILEGLANGASQ